MDVSSLTDKLIAARTFHDLLEFATSDDLPRMLSAVEPYIRLHQRVNDVVLSRLLAGPLLTPQVANGSQTAMEFVESRHGEQAAALYKRLAFGAADKTLLLRAGGQTELQYPASFFVATMVTTHSHGCAPSSAHYFGGDMAAVQRDALAQSARQRLAALASSAGGPLAVISQDERQRAAALANAEDVEYAEEDLLRFREVMKLHGRARRVLIDADSDVPGLMRIEEDELVSGLSEVAAFGTPPWQLHARRVFEMKRGDQPMQEEASSEDSGLRPFMTEADVDEFWDSISPVTPVVPPRRVGDSRPDAATTTARSGGIGGSLRLALPRKLPVDQRSPANNTTVAAANAWAAPSAASRLAFLVDSSGDDDEAILTTRQMPKAGIARPASVNEYDASNDSQPTAAPSSSSGGGGKFAFDEKGALVFIAGRRRAAAAAVTTSQIAPMSNSHAAVESTTVTSQSVAGASAAAITTSVSAPPPPKMHRVEVEAGNSVAQEMSPTQPSLPDTAPSATDSATTLTLETALITLPHFVQLAAFVGLRAKGLR